MDSLNVTLARTCGMSFFCIFLLSVYLTMLAVRRYPRSLEVLAGHINHPQLPELTRRFLFDQLNKNSDITLDRAILIVRQSGADSEARTTRGDAHKDDDW